MATPDHDSFRGNLRDRAELRGRNRGRSSRSRRRSMSRGRKRWLIGGAVAALAGLGVVIGYPAFLAITFETQTTSIPDAFPEERFRPPLLEGDAAEGLNILLMGSDSRQGLTGDINDIGGTRSDSMMLVHVPSDRESVQVISIMRDSWVDIPGRGENKVNAALAFGGVSLAVQTIEQLVGVRIDRVAIIDFEGFAGMSEAIGGVTLTNQVAFSTTAAEPIFFPEGEITVRGQEALEYVRERRAFATGDYQRVRNQQAFIRGFMAKVLNAETLTNPARVGGLVQAVSPYLAVDDGFTAGFVAELALELSNVRVADVSFFTLPTTGIGTIAGQSVVLIDEEQLAIIRTALQEDSLASYTPPVPAL